MKLKTSLSDTPLGSEINDFGTERYVNGLIRFIERSSTPITIALQGEWGSGKTSLMNKLHDGLCGEHKPFIGITVNTWEYSMLSSPELAVISILEYLINSLTKNDKESKKVVSGFLKNAQRALKISVHETLKTVSMGATAGLTNDWANPTSDNGGEKITLTELRKAITTAIDKSLTDGKKGVIVFVDDLDRLNPPLAVEILELLKNVFTLENCIFVLAIDYEVVVKGLKPKFGELTDKNEREFRSFFDKIIQVPFSLPVNNYRPMDFVLKSLVEIGYLKDFDATNPYVTRQLTSVVEWSVGKNPRSIKRLINTLSLLDCIAQCGVNLQKDATSTIEEKLLNFIVVAIQICYPKVYKLLVKKPAFTTWDEHFAKKEGIIVNSDDSLTPDVGDESRIDWEDVLDAVCDTDKYLTQHKEDINNLFEKVIELNKENGGDEESLGFVLKKILDKSSVTGIDSGTKVEDFDVKDFIYRLHDNVIGRMKELRPDITNFQPKKNRGKNGGVIFRLSKDFQYDVIFTPEINTQNEVSLRIWLDFQVPRPDRYKGKPFDELWDDEQLLSAVKEVDHILTPLLSSDRNWFFEGKHFEGAENYVVGFKDYFRSYRDELRYLHQRGWLDGNITNNPEFWIKLKKPSHFEEKNIVDILAKLLIANYDFRKKMLNWK